MSLAFNDADFYGPHDDEFLGPFSLQPSALFAFELDNTAFGDKEGGYVQLGVKPNIVLFKSAAYPLTLALPLSLGLSLYDYYEIPGVGDDTFGFFDIGLIGSVPLAFIPAEYGAWSWSLGVDFLAFGSNTQLANLDDATQWVGKTGFVFWY